MSKKEKKLSDIILNLEHEVGLIHKYVKNIDLTNKLILKELRSNEERIINGSGGSSSIDTPSSSPPPSASNLTVTAPDVSVPAVADGKKLVIDQKVVFASNGKNLSLAPVEIFDSTNSLVKRTRTNTSGRWTAQLVPGQYRVHISKIGSKNKVIADMQFIIKVDSSTSTLPEVRIK